MLRPERLSTPLNQISGAADHHMINLFLSIMLQHPLDQVCQELLRHHGRRDLFCIAALAQKLRLFLPVSSILKAL